MCENAFAAHPTQSRRANVTGFVNVHSFFYYFKSSAVEEYRNIKGETGSRLEFEQGDVSTIGSQHQFLQVPHLFGRLGGSFRVDSQHDLVGCWPCGPAADNA